MSITEETAKRTRGNAPVTILFADEAGNRGNKPVAPVKIILKDRSNVEREYDFSNLPSDVLVSLAATGFARIIDVYVRNNGDKDSNYSDALAIAEKRAGEVLSGNLFPKRNGRGGAGPRGPRVDVGMYADAMRKYLEITRQAYTEQDIEAWKDRFLSYDAKQRMQVVTQLKGIPQFKAALLEQELKRTKEVAKTKGREGAPAFNPLSM